MLGGVWVPPEEPPCSVNPDQWSDAVYYEKESILQYEAITTCMYMCPFRIDCLRSALAEEGADMTHFRIGIRGGTLPKDRYRMYKDSVKKKRLQRVLEGVS